MPILTGPPSFPGNNEEALNSLKDRFLQLERLLFPSAYTLQLHTGHLEAVLPTAVTYWGSLPDRVPATGIINEFYFRSYFPTDGVIRRAVGQFSTASLASGELSQLSIHMNGTDYLVGEVAFDTAHATVLNYKLAIRVLKGDYVVMRLDAPSPTWATPPTAFCRGNVVLYVEVG